MAAYRRQLDDVTAVNAICEDYRAGATIDRQLDEADRGRELACPGALPVGRTGRPPRLLRRRARRLARRGLPGSPDVPSMPPTSWWRTSRRGGGGADRLLPDRLTAMTRWSSNGRSGGPARRTATCPPRCGSGIPGPDAREVPGVGAGRDAHPGVQRNRGPRKPDSPAWDYDCVGLVLALISSTSSQNAPAPVIRSSALRTTMPGVMVHMSFVVCCRCRHRGHRCRRCRRRPGRGR